MVCSPGLSPPVPPVDEVPPVPETPGLPPSTVVPPLAPLVPPPSPPAPPRALPCPPTPPPPPPPPATRTRSDRVQVSAAQPPVPRRTSEEPPAPDPLPPLLKRFRRRHLLSRACRHWSHQSHRAHPIRRRGHSSCPRTGLRLCRQLLCRPYSPGVRPLRSGLTRSPPPRHHCRLDGR